MRKCSKCGEHKDASEFYANKLGRDGLGTRCKKCHTATTVRLAQTHEPARQAKLRRTQDWKDGQHPDVFAARIRNNELRRKYGITSEQFNELLMRQGGACAICRGTLKKLHVDHDHQTGRVRGLLCNCCNVGLGMFRDDVAALRGAIAYLST